MGLRELTPFIREAVTHLHDLAILHTAWVAAGHFGKGGTIYKRFAHLARTEDDRKALAELMFACVSNTIGQATWFIEERVTMNQMSVTVSDGSQPYTMEGTDMLHSWFGMICEQQSKETPDTMLDEINRVAAGGEIRTMPEYAEFPAVRPAE